MNQKDRVAVHFKIAVRSLTNWLFSARPADILSALSPCSRYFVNIFYRGLSWKCSMFERQLAKGDLPCEDRSYLQTILDASSDISQSLSIISAMFVEKSPCHLSTISLNPSRPPSLSSPPPLSLSHTHSASRSLACSLTVCFCIFIRLFPSLFQTRIVITLSLSTYLST